MMNERLQPTALVHLGETLTDPAPRSILGVQVDGNKVYEIGTAAISQRPFSLGTRIILRLTDRRKSVTLGLRVEDNFVNEINRLVGAGRRFFIALDFTKKENRGLIGVQLYAAATMELVDGRREALFSLVERSPVMSIAERIESHDISILRACRMAGVKPARVYHAADLDDDEIKAIEGVLAGVRSGAIARRRAS